MFTSRRGKSVAVLGLFLILSVGILAQGDEGTQRADSSISSGQVPSEPTETYENRIQKLLDVLKSEDPEKVRQAKNKLFQIGRRAMPAIREKLKASEGGVYYQLLQQMKSLFKNSMGGRLEPKSEKGILEWLSVEEEVESIEQWTKNTDVPENETLLIDRYREALQRYKSDQPRKALQIAKAILIVSPELSFKKKLERFIRKCRQRIFNNYTLQANITTGKVRYGWEEKIRLVFRLKNRSDKTLTIYFDKPEDGFNFRNTSPVKSQEESESSPDGSETEEADGPNSDSGSNGDEPRQDNEKEHELMVSEEISSTKTIVLEMKEEKIGLRGNRVTETHYREYNVPARVTLPPGDVWSKEVELDRSELKHRYVLRRITLGARTIPSMVEAGQRSVNRWILFSKASFELYPKGMREALPATVEKVKRHLQSENLRDVFFLTFLLEEKEREELVPYFLKVLPFLKRNPARTIMFLLQELTGKQFLYNREQWLEWGRNQYDIEVQPPDKEQSQRTGPNFTK